MNKYLLLGATAVLAMGSSSAWAQASYTAKSQDTTLGQARYDYGQQQPVRQSAQAEPSPMQVLGVEPAAGESNNNPYDDFRGPYIGADIGYDFGSYETDTGDVGLKGADASGFVGYGYSLGNRHTIGGYGALELAYEWNNSDGNIGATTFEKKHAWKALFKPGLVVKGDAVGYGIVGYSRAKFETDTSDENFDGLVLGAGTEFNTGLPVRMRLEYEYTNYEDKDLGATGFDGSESVASVGALLRF